MKKFFVLFFLNSFLFLTAQANQINDYIKQTNFEKNSTVSVYVANEKNEDILFKKNEEKLVNPASILKVLTFGASYLVLGNDYNFETSFYIDSCKNLYLKLGGDVLLTSADLDTLVQKLKEKINSSAIKNIYIDDSIFEKGKIPSSWTQDDEIIERQITPYIIDNNFMEIAIKRSSLSNRVDVIQNDKYKLPVLNELKIGDFHKVKIDKEYPNETLILSLKGTVAKDEIIKMPVVNPEINFNVKLISALEKNGIECANQIVAKKAPFMAKKVATVSHDIEEISKNILHNSDNFSAEVVFRVAGAKNIDYTRSATLEDAIEMFKEVYAYEITDEITIADGSGVSRFNLINAKFACECFKKLLLISDIKTLMPTANQGTLSNRMMFLENNLRAKTGTLANMSSIMGSFTTRENKDIVFCVIVQNSPERKALLKNFENSLVGIIYKEF